MMNSSPKKPDPIQLAANRAAMCTHSHADTINLACPKGRSAGFTPAYYCCHPKLSTGGEFACRLILVRCKGGKFMGCNHWKRYSGHEELTDAEMQEAG